ncbi:MAG: glycosyltransferase family 4 protein [Candidatus Bathyarchaeota archaeon]|nr:glycosyltransferase family 4 protein [Candidatus Bathyarchaeota archaeon]
MKIGYYYGNYDGKRNILHIVPELDYVRVHDLKQALVMSSMVCNKLYKHSLFDVNDNLFSFNDFNLNRVDIMHFFNTISFGRTPWITTFETIVPRFSITLKCHHGRTADYSPLIHEKQIQGALEALSNDSCKKLIALSECNLNMQKQLLRHFPQYRSEVENKLIHLHPPQEVFFDSYESKNLDLDGQISFAFVGRDFFRKGGMEILETFRDLRKNNGYNLRLTVVSSLSMSDYATNEIEEDVEAARDIIQTNNDWIDYYHSLPSQRVLELMRRSHIGLLPTYADTYGYSTLEFQASGCPVISTDVRALPEINNNEIGWLIKIPKNYLGEAIYTNKEDRLQIGDAIKEGLERAVSEIFANRSVIIQKANAALERVRNQHSPEEYSRRIAEIYHCALE